MKKGESSKFRGDNKNQREFSPSDEDHASQHLLSVIGEIKMITGGPSTGGLFRSLKKAYQKQVNNVYRTPPFIQRWTNQDMCFSKEDARGVK